MDAEQNPYASPQADLTPADAPPRASWAASLKAGIFVLFGVAGISSFAFIVFLFVYVVPKEEIGSPVALVIAVTGIGGLGGGLTMLHSARVRLMKSRAQDEGGAD
jgi:hypothetical protein